MANITQDQAMRDLSFLLGESSVPTSGVEDRETFIQRALERVYRLHDFPMNKINATVPLIAGVASLPVNMGQDGLRDVREVLPGTRNDRVYTSIPYEDQDNYDGGSYRYWLEGYESAYTLHTNEPNDATLRIRYETSVPVVNASIPTPFPSSMALARGALVYYRQAEDPQADIAQEEAIFQQEVDEVWAKYNRNRPRQPRGRTLYEANGTYLGDVSGSGVVD